MECQIQWHGKLCNSESIGKIKVTMHSNIYSGVFEIGNRDVSYEVCQEHFDKAKIKDDKTIVFIPN